MPSKATGCFSESLIEGQRPKSCPSPQSSPKRSSPWLVAVLLLFSTCSKASRPHVERITIDQFEGQAILGLTPAHLDGRLRRALESSKFVLLKDAQPAPDGVAAWRLRLAVNIVEPDPDQGPVGRVEGVLSLAQRGEDDAFDVMAHDSKTASSNRVEDIQEATGIALEQVLVGMASEAKALIELRTANDAKLIEKLGGSEVAARDAAVTLLARRRNPAALKSLLKRLESQDPADIRRAMGLLIELRDPNAVPALIDVSRARDNIVQREVVFALGAIGGDEAEAYLWSVAQGHDDALIRASAQQALEELKAKKPGAPK